MGSADKRRSQVLSAIVSDFVSTGEPVGSMTLVARHKLGVSPATIRNDMSVLEAQGYLYQPHTSAGRVPTEKGYRCFVDQITSLQPLRPAQRKALETFLVEAHSIDEVLERTVKLLAQLTHQLAVIQYPKTVSYGLRHLELVPVGERQLLVVAITDTAKVSQRLLEIPITLDNTQIMLLRELLNRHLSGCSRAQIETLLPALSSALALAFPVDDKALLLLSETTGEIIQVVLEALTETSERIVIAGAGNLVRAETEFSSPISEILDVLEEQVALLQLFNEARTDDEVHVAIGSETGKEELGETAIVTSTYAANPYVRPTLESTYASPSAHAPKVAPVPAAHLGVVGPRRMDYRGAMSTVKAVSKYLSEYLKGG